MIRKVDEPALVLAPMEGLVDAVVRDLYTRIGGIDWCVSEFIRVTHQLLPRKLFLKQIPEAETNFRTPSGVVVYPQLLGGDPLWLAENAKVLVDMGAPGVDLNFGCPAPTVNRHDGGATLLKVPQRIEDCVRAVRAVVPAELPVSAKMRLGFDHKEDHVALAQAAAHGGASWITVHARTKADGYRPPAYWEYLPAMGEAVGPLPLIANGEIWKPEDASRCREITGCAALMCGRGAIARPFLFREIRDGIAPASWGEVAPWVVLLGDESQAYRGDGYACDRSKQWLKLLARTYPEAQTVFKYVKTHREWAEFRAALVGALTDSDRNSWVRTSEPRTALI